MSVCVPVCQRRPPWSAHNAAKVNLNSVNYSLLYILSVLSPSRMIYCLHWFTVGNVKGEEQVDFPTLNHACT